jgi:hypothetical protein
MGVPSPELLAGHMSSHVSEHDKFQEVFEFNLKVAVLLSGAAISIS